MSNYTTQNYTFSGLNNAAEYTTSGLPYAHVVTIVTGANRVDFPFVTNNLYIQNPNAFPIYLGFTANGVMTTEKMIVFPSSTLELRHRLKTVYVSGSGTAYVGASLTTILPRSFPVLTGSAPGAGTYNAATTASIYGYGNGGTGLGWVNW